MKSSYISVIITIAIVLHLGFRIANADSYIFGTDTELNIEDKSFTTNTIELENIRMDHSGITLDNGPIQFVSTSNLPVSLNTGTLEDNLIRETLLTSH